MYKLWKFQTNWEFLEIFKEKHLTCGHFPETLLIIRNYIKEFSGKKIDKRELSLKIVSILL